MPVHLGPLPRRQFLACTLAARLRAAVRSRDEHRFVLISDPHIAADRAKDRTQQVGWVVADLGTNAVRLELRGLDRSHPEHGRIIQLDWRT
ncbi:MAG: hypothetical protein V4773_22895 [Verrucomicrobiota bacterium]